MNQPDEVMIRFARAAERGQQGQRVDARRLLTEL